MLLLCAILVIQNLIMPLSKHYFEQFKDEIAEEHKKFETHLEQKELTNEKCTHFGKVEFVNGELRCRCGAGWAGPNLDILYELFNPGN
jgi:hypothetical protein